MPTGQAYGYDVTSRPANRAQAAEQEDQRCTRRRSSSPGRSAPNDDRVAQQVAEVHASSGSAGTGAASPSCGIASRMKLATVSMIDRDRGADRLLGERGDEQPDRAQRATGRPRGRAQTPSSRSRPSPKPTWLPESSVTVAAAEQRQPDEQADGGDQQRRRRTRRSRWRRTSPPAAGCGAPARPAGSAACRGSPRRPPRRRRSPPPRSAGTAAARRSSAASATNSPLPVIWAKKSGPPPPPSAPSARDLSPRR